MTVDKLQRLFQALDGSTPTSRTPASSAEKSEQNQAAPQPTSEAVRISPELRRQHSQPSEAERAARVADLKQQYEAGTLKPADSEQVAAKLLVELF